MDPLSLAANVITVCGAASAAAKSLEKFTSLRHVPEQLLQLLNEVADVRVVLFSVGETCRQLTDLNVEQSLLSQLTRKIGEAGAILDHLNELIQSRLIINYKETVRDPSLPHKISWKWWLKSQKIIQILVERLREKRQDIAADLMLLTASQHSLISLQVQNIAFTTDRIASLLHEQQSHQVKNDTRNQLSDYLQTENGRSFAQVGTSLFPEIRCSTMCMCRCHRRKTSRTPRAIDSLIGTIFIGYSGLPLLSDRACSEVSCRREESCLVKINYYFPRWFLARIVIFQSVWSSLHDYNLTIRTPRSIPYSSELFLVVTNNNLSSVQTLFANGLASPFDVGEADGWSALHTAVKGKKAEMCKFLLDQGADHNLEDRAGLSPLEMVWTDFLTDSSPKSLAMNEVFRPFMNLEEFIPQHRFTVLDRIVLGLVPLDLEQQLQVTTSSINTRSGTGKTALLWAVLLGDLAKVRILLKYGADVRLADSTGDTPIHYAAIGSGNDSCEIITAIIQAFPGYSNVGLHGIYCGAPLSFDDKEDRSDKLPRYLSAVGRNTTPLILAIQDQRTSNAKLLLENGAYINAMNENHATPLLAAIQHNHHAILKILLDLRPDIHVLDKEKTGVLHYSAMLGDTRTLEMLAQAKLSGLDIGHQDIDGYTPLQAFETVRPILTNEDVVTRSQCRTLLEKILRNASSSDLDEEGMVDSGKAIDSISIDGPDQEGEEMYFDALS